MNKRHRFTDAEMLRGTKKALRNPRTPSQLRPGLRRLRDRLKSRIGERKVSSGKKNSVSKALGL